MKPESSDPLSHVDEAGRVRMVDVSSKEPSERVATASAVVTMRPEVLAALLEGSLRKGEALTTAKLAGINGAKMTSRLVPLCHVVPIEWVEVALDRLDERRLRISTTVKTHAKTGVEMEAMTGAATAALTVYDMAKASDKEITIGPIRLEAKTGGKSGPFRRGV